MDEKKQLFSPFHQQAMFSHVLGRWASISIAVVQEDGCFHNETTPSPFAGFIAGCDDSWCGIAHWLV